MPADSPLIMSEDYKVKLPGNTLVRTKPTFRFSFSSYTNSQRPQDNYIDTIISDNRISEPADVAS